MKDLAARLAEEAQARGDEHLAKFYEMCKPSEDDDERQE